MWPSAHTHTHAQTHTQSHIYSMAMPLHTYTHETEWGQSTLKDCQEMINMFCSPLPTSPVLLFLLLTAPFAPLCHPDTSIPWEKQPTLPFFFPSPLHPADCLAVCVCITFMSWLRACSFAGCKMSAGASGRSLFWFSVSPAPSPPAIPNSHTMTGSRPVFVRPESRCNTHVCGKHARTHTGRSCTRHALAKAARSHL